MDLELSALVRIITDVVEFDWFSPYKKDDGYQSVGTGFFIDNNGYILTCAHVVEDAIKVSIVIPAIGKDKFDAEIIATCPATDIALLRAVNYKNKSYLKIGDSDGIKPKDGVTAIGYPLGQDRLKYTSGIVSGIQGSLIQTDAPINPGNSGGPLVDKNNKVVGINSSKIPAADNIGYSIPIHIFNIMKDVMYSGKTKVIKKPELLTSFNNTDKNILGYTGSKCQTGYLVKKIYKISPLYTAGIRDGDIICSFDGYKLDNFGETEVKWSTQKVHIKELLDRYNIGDVVDITYWNNAKKKMKTTKVKFTDNEDFKIKTIYPEYESIDYEIVNGCVIMELTINHLDDEGTFNFANNIYDNLNKYYETENRFEPVLIITKIFGGSYADKLGNIKEGDILQKVNDTEVKTLKDFRKAIKKCHNKKYIVFTTEEQNVFVNTVKDMIDEEQFLSDRHGYNISKLYNKLKGIPAENDDSDDEDDNDDVKVEEPNTDDYDPMWDYLLVAICALIIYLTLKKN